MPITPTHITVIGFEIVNELNNKVGDQLAVSVGCDFHLSFENIKDAIAILGATPSPKNSIF